MLFLQIDCHPRQLYLARFLIGSCCAATMDVFKQLNYCYPGASNATRLHVSQPPQEFPYHAQIPNNQSTDQTHLGVGYTRSDSRRITHPLSSLDSTAGCHSRSEQKSGFVDPPGAFLSNAKRPVKLYYMDDPTNQPDQYIPSSSDKITCTDHRPLDDIFGNTRPLSLSGWSGSPHLTQSGMLQAHPQHTAVLTYPLPTKPQLDGVLHIPLLAVDNQMSGTGLVVDFRCSDWGIGVEVEGMCFRVLVRPHF